jgi:L-fuconolactonase
LIVDAHVHVVAPDESRYPLRPSGVGSQWFREHPVTADEYAATAAAAGVDRAVLVQAYGAYSSDNSYVLDAVAVAPERFVSVVIVDPEDPEAPANLRRLAAVPGCGGVRLFGIGPMAPTWFDGAPGRALWEVAAGLDLPVVVTLLAPELRRLRAMLARFPEVLVVLDHCGFPDLRGGPPFRESSPLFDLAAFPALHLKVTSHVLEAADASAAPRGAAALVERLAAVFGAERLVWGSDYPQTHDRTYGELFELGRASCAGLPVRDRDRVLGGNALRLWPMLVG